MKGKELGEMGTQADDPAEVNKDTRPAKGSPPTRSTTESGQAERAGSGATVSAPERHSGHQGRLANGKEGTVHPQSARTVPLGFSL